MPLDLDVKHPFILWARTIGGILMANGFTDFLANYGQRKTADDPIRRGLGLLGLQRNGDDEWLPSPEWAKLAVDLGLSKVVIPEADRENEASRARGMGVVLHAHNEETFEVESDTEKLTLKLEQRRGRWGGEPHNRWRFVVLNRQDLPVDDLPQGIPEAPAE